MTKKTKEKEIHYPGTEDNPQVAKDTYDFTITDFINKKLVAYMSYTVTDRAVPSIVDGLKKGQRRLLYSAYDAGITPDAKPRKSARVVSDATGKYHPHGQTSMYDTLSTLAHEYGRVRLIEGMGSFGMNPGDPAASERYTEARLSPEGMEVVRDMRDEPVNMVPTYDGTNTEPIYLPSRFPVAPLTGSVGMACGYSVTIPSHNPIEFLNLTRALLTNPDMSPHDMRAIMPGPDWGTGASVVGSAAQIEQYYAKGTGHLIVRSEIAPGDKEVILTHIAPGMGLRTMLSQIRASIRGGDITTVTGADDHSDMDKGTYVVFPLKRGVTAQDAIDELLTTGGLEATYAVNMVFTDRDNIPRTWGIKDVINNFLTLRDEVLVNRSQAAIDTANKKLVKATAIAAIVVDKDKAVACITGADDRDTAAVAIMDAFDLTEEQARYVTSLPLYRLTKADRLDAVKNVADLKKEIERLQKLINSPALRKKEIDKELAQSIATFEEAGMYARRTTIDDMGQRTAKKTEEISDEERLSSWNLDTEMGILSEHGDKITEGDYVWVVFGDGRVKLFNGNGLPKRVSPTPVTPDITGMVACGTLTPGKDRLACVSSSGKILALETGEDSRFNPQGKAGNGVAGMKLGEGDSVVAGFVLHENDSVFTQSIDGWKVTKGTDIPSKGRNTTGVMVHKLRAEDVAVVTADARPTFTAQGKELKPTARSKATQRGSIMLDDE